MKEAEAKVVTRWQCEVMSVIAENGLEFLERNAATISEAQQREWKQKEQREVERLQQSRRRREEAEREREQQEQREEERRGAASQPAKGTNLPPMLDKPTQSMGRSHSAPGVVVEGVSRAVANQVEQQNAPIRINLKNFEPEVREAEAEREERNRTMGTGMTHQQGLQRSQRAGSGAGAASGEQSRPARENGGEK